MTLNDKPLVCILFAHPDPIWTVGAHGSAWVCPTCRREVPPLEPIAPAYAVTAPRQVPRDQRRSTTNAGHGSRP